MSTTASEVAPVAPHTPGHPKFPIEIFEIIFHNVYDSVDTRKEFFSALNSHSLVCRQFNTMCHSHYFYKGVELGDLRWPSGPLLTYSRALTFLKRDPSLVKHIKMAVFSFKTDDYGDDNDTRSSKRLIAPEFLTASNVRRLFVSHYIVYTVQRPVPYEPLNPAKALGYRTILEQSYQTLTFLSFKDIDEIPLLSILSACGSLEDLQLEGCSLLDKPRPTVLPVSASLSGMSATGMKGCPSDIMPYTYNLQQLYLGFEKLNIPQGDPKIPSSFPLLSELKIYVNSAEDFIFMEDRLLSNAKALQELSIETRSGLSLGLSQVIPTFSKTLTKLQVEFEIFIHRPDVEAIHDTLYQAKLHGPCALEEITLSFTAISSNPICEYETCRGDCRHDIWRNIDAILMDTVSDFPSFQKLKFILVLDDLQPLGGTSKARKRLRKWGLDCLEKHFQTPFPLLYAASKITAVGHPYDCTLPSGPGNYLESESSGSESECESGEDNDDDDHKDSDSGEDDDLGE